MAQKKEVRILEIPVTVTLSPSFYRWDSGGEAGFRPRPLQAVDGDGRSQGRAEGSSSNAASSGQDAWTVRRQFLDVRTLEDCLHFLNQTGVFSKLLLGRQVPNLTWEEVKGWQRLLVGILVRPATAWDNWLSSQGGVGDEARRMLVDALKIPISVPRHPRTRRAVFEADDALSAIFATILVDHLRGAKFSVCHRPDCKKMFELTSNHVRRYCSAYCAHFESLRRLRRRERTKG